jgi:transcriptional regulator with XRE-family HTH domain
VSLAAAVADEVRKRMRRARLSQNALAKRAGIAPTLVHRAMSGERVLSIDELGAVAAALGVKPEQLVRVAREGIESVTPSSECSESNSVPASD